MKDLPDKTPFLESPKMLLKLCHSVIEELLAKRRDRELDEREKQLQEISRTIDKLEKSNVSVPDELRNLKTDLIAELTVREEIDNILKDLAGGLDELLKDLHKRIGSVNKDTKKTSRKIKRKKQPKTHQDTLRKEIIKALKALGGRGHKKKVFASIVKKEQVHKLQAIFSKAGYNLKGITAIPFAIQNFIHTNHLQVKDSPFSIINLSRENSEMFCFSDSGILMARKVRSDLYSLVADAVRSSGKDTIESFSSIKDFQSDKNFQIRQSCERLTDKIVRTGEYCSQNFANNTPMKKFVIFGETDDSDSFMDLMKKTIPVDVEKFEPVLDTLPGTIEVGLPQNIVERNKVVLAFGIALSSNAYTPNFIYTYRDKLKKIKQRKINIAVAMFIIILFLGCTMVYSWQKTVESRETVKLNTLSQRKSTFAKDVNPKATLELISNAKTKLNLMSRYVSAYLPLAVINEICSLTPKNIRISSLESDFDVPGKKENRKKVESKVLIAQVMIEGKVLPMENNPESDLTQYLLGLGDSQLFENIKVLQKSTYKDQEDTGLNFKLTMDVL